MEASDLLPVEERISILRNFQNRLSDNDVISISRKYRGYVNVEPVLIMMAAAVGLYIISMPLFIYWARCIEIASEIPDIDAMNVTAICAQLCEDQLIELQNIVGRDIASTKIYLQTVNTIPTLIVSPLLGIWSDKRGRKNPLLLSIFGFSIYTLFQLLATLTYSTINIYYWLFAGELILGLTGGVGSIFSTSLAIVIDECRNKLSLGSSTVPLRIGVASFLQSIGSLLGVMVMSLLAVKSINSNHIHQLSYVKATSLQIGFAFMAFIYTFFIVRETHFPQNDVSLFNTNNADISTTTNTNHQSSFTEMISKNILVLFEVVSQKRPGWTRCCLVMSLFFVMVEFLALDTSLLFLLVKRQPFSWSDEMFSYYSLIRGVLYSLGMILCPVLLTFVHWLGKDSLMILIGIAASALSFILIGCANSTAVIFLATGLTILCGGIAPGYRSFLPRMVSKEQTARLLTICSIIMAFCPMISAVIFNSIFYMTINWWPGFTFFVGGLLQLFVVAGQSAIHFLMRPQWLLEKKLRNQIVTHSMTVGDECEDSDQSVSTIAVDVNEDSLDDV